MAPRPTLSPSEREKLKSQTRDRIVAARATEVNAHLLAISDKVSATSAAVDIILGQLDKVDELSLSAAQSAVKIDAIHRSVRDLQGTITGDGKDGLVTRVKLLEDTRRRWAAIALAGLTAGVGALATWMLESGRLYALLDLVRG